MKLLTLGDKFNGKTVIDIFSDGKNPWIRVEGNQVFTGHRVEQHLNQIERASNEE